MVSVLGSSAATPPGTPPHPRPVRPLALSVLQAVRPLQWVKNLAVGLPLLLHASAWSGRALLETIVAFGLFTLGAAATYLVNDLTDRRRDALHPAKRTRPIASGAIRPVFAAVLAGLLYALLALAIAAHSGPMTAPVIVYVVMNLLYSRLLKHVALLDIFVLAAGFVLRVLAGAFAVGAPISSWLVLCVLSGSLVLALGKRRQEMTQAVSRPQDQRPALRGYSAQLIDNLLPIAGAVCMVAYVSMLGTEVAHRPFGMTMVLVSTLLAMFGLARYIQVVLGGGGADPAHTMLRDPALLTVGVLWTGTFIAVPMVAGLFAGR